MKKNKVKILKKGVFLPFTLILCFLIIVAGLLIWRYKFDKDSLPKVNPNQLGENNNGVASQNRGAIKSTWKTYNNEKFGFSFEIPNDSYVSSVDRYGTYFQISLPDKPATKINLTAIFYIDKPKTGEYSDVWHERNLIIDDMSGIQSLTPVYGTELEKPRPLSLVTRFGSETNNRFFVLTLDGVIKANSKNDDLVNLIFQQTTYQHILDTFGCCSITKQTYQNSQYGYSLVVPLGWNINDGGSGVNIEINSPGPDGSSISLSARPKGPYMWNDKIVYPRNVATLQPSEKTTIIIAGKDYDLFVYTSKDGHLLEQVELITPQGDTLLVSISDRSQGGFLINHMRDILESLTFTKSYE